MLTGFIQFSNADELWIRQVSNTTKSFSHVFFTDTLNGWSAGDSGIIVHTTNGGTLWQIQNTNTENYIYDLRFLNSNTGWAIADNYFGYPDAVLLKTTNSGSNWIKLPFPDTTLLLFTICFQNEFTGWVAGYQGKILKTTDGGINWIIQQNDTSQFRYNNINRIEFYNYQIGTACGGNTDLSGVLWSLTNSGSQWFAHGVAGEPLYDITYLDSNRIFSVGGDFELGLIVLKSTNSGSTWDFNPVSFFGPGKTIAFRTGTEAWIPMYFSIFFSISTDAGQNWFEMSTPDSSSFNDIMFTDSLHGWAAGLNGAIYRYNSSLIGIINNRKSVSDGFEIFPNYPNPFNSSTLISFRIFKRSTVKIIIYDVLGQKRQILTDGSFQSGMYRFNFDGTGLASGIYFCKININNSTTTKKMVLIK